MTKPYIGDANAYALSIGIGTDEAVAAHRAKEAKHLRKLWRDFRDKHPKLAAQIKHMTDEELADFEIELLERLLTAQPDNAGAQYDLRLARSIRASRSRPRRQVERRQWTKPVNEPAHEPDRAPPMPLPAWAATPPPSPPSAPAASPKPQPQPSNVVAFKPWPKAFGTDGRDLDRKVIWHGLSDW